MARRSAISPSRSALWIGPVGLLLLLISAAVGHRPLPSSGLIGALAVDAVSAYVTAQLAMLILRAPRSWLLPMLTEIWSALALGTGLFALLPESAGLLGVLCLVGLPALLVAWFTRIQATDALWFFVLIGVTRFLHLLI